MTAGKVRTVVVFVAIVLAATHLTGAAHAQSSLGIGTNDAMPSGTGLFAHQLMWINQQQQAFYRSLAAAMKAMRSDGSKLWLLIGLSFAYGVFHAAGPGHGKAVISSYMLANEVALRRGILLSFISALLQALTAIAVMTLAYFVLRGTSVSMTDAAWFLEIMSYVLVTAFGAWLLWRKAGPAVLRLFRARPAYTLSAAHAGALQAGDASDGDAKVYLLNAHREGIQRRPGPGNMRAVETHGHTAGEVCETCGHAHLPDPSLISGDRFDWRTAWSAVAAVGIRPCSGALIVLSFAFLNGLWTGGILSVLAMALGTAITVSALATMAVTAKNWAVTLAGNGRLGSRIHSIIEIGGAAFVFVVGLLLLSASLSG